MRDGRTYRLEPADETGWAFGLELHQLIICGCGVLGGTLLMSTINVAMGVGVVIVGVGAGVVRVGGRTLVTALPHVIRWMRFRRAADEGNASTSETGLCGEVVNIDPGGHGIDGLGSSIAVRRDPHRNTYAATLRAHGHDFALAEPDDQDRHLDMWAATLEQLAAPQRANVAIHWTQHSRPHSTVDHEHWLARHQSDTLTSSARHHYTELLATHAAAATRHDTLLTVTVEGPPRFRQATGWHEPTIGLLCRKLHQLQQRLTNASVSVGVLDEAALETAIGERTSLGPGTTAPFGQRSGASTESTSSSTWTHVRIGSSVHRSYEISGWPRHELAASWMTELLHWNGATHTIAIHLQPVPKSESHRRIRRDTAKLETDSADRAARGFHVGAHHRRAAQAVHQREEELVAGHSEYRYAGVISIAAASEGELDTASRELQQVAATVGIELRPLHGQHSAGVQAVLPAGGTVR